MEKREEARKAPVGSLEVSNSFFNLGRFQQAAEEEVRQLADRRRGKSNKVLFSGILSVPSEAHRSVQCRKSYCADASASVPSQLSGATRDFLPPASRILAHFDI